MMLLDKKTVINKEAGNTDKPYTAKSSDENTLGINHTLEPDILVTIASYIDKRFLFIKVLKELKKCAGLNALCS